LREYLSVEPDAIASGLQCVRLAGRVQTVPGRVEQVLDVSHNAQAARALCDALMDRSLSGKTHAVIGMMQDKDAESFARELGTVVSHWYPVGLKTERASTSGQLAGRLSALFGKENVSRCGSVGDAIRRLKTAAKPGDRVLVCGSFYTVAEWAALKPKFES
jgi:dihydrofolate synthase/folylpolyglutamate synthase